MPYKDISQKRQYQRLWVAKRRAEWFATKVCDICGTKTNLDLHHVDKSTKISHKIFSWTKERREKELKKCVARCRKCHIGLHNKER